MENKKRKKRRIIVFITIILILLCVISGITAALKNTSNLSNKISVGKIETATVEQRDISNYISVSGNVESENLVKITGTVIAKIESLNVELGSSVKKGDILCVFDCSELQKQYDSLVKSMKNLEKQNENTHKINERNLDDSIQNKEISLAQAQRIINNAIDSRDRAYQKESDIFDSLNQACIERDALKETLNSIEPEDNPEAYADVLEKIQEAEIAVRTKEETLEALRDQLSTYDEAVESAYDAYAEVERNSDMAILNCQDVIDLEQFQQDNDYESELKKLEDEINECTVRAPRDGIITSINIAEGSFPSTEELMTIEDTDILKITVNIDEADILNVHEGMTAVVKTSATGETEYSALVSRVVNIYTKNPESGTGGYSAEITLDDSSDTELLIGMNAKVKIILEEKKDVLALPYDSIITDDNGKSFVLLADTQDDGTTKAKSVEVEKGIEGNYYTEIISDEIHKGDKVVSTPEIYHDGDVLPISELQENSYE